MHDFDFFIFQKAKKPNFDDISLEIQAEDASDKCVTSTPSATITVPTKNDKNSESISNSSSAGLAVKPSPQFPVNSGSSKLAPLTNSSTSVAPRQRPRGSANPAAVTALPPAAASGKTTVPLPPLPSPSQPKAGKVVISQGNIQKKIRKKS